MKRLMLAALLAVASAPAAMAQTPYISQLRLFALDFCPYPSYIPADGSLQIINQNTALFSLLGIMYGGDGNSTFALPKMAPPALKTKGNLIYCIAQYGVFPPRP